MAILITGLILFLGVHSIAIVNEPWRNRMAARMGELAWKGAYAVVALAGLVLIIQGYGAARYDPVALYSSPAWLRYISFLLLIPVFPLLVAAYFPGRIKRATKHPMLLAVMLWSLAHMLSNGNLADLLLFGGLLAWAVAEWVSLAHRAARAIPVAAYSRLNDIIALLGGLILYVVTVLWLHRVLTGVPLV